MPTDPVVNRVLDSLMHGIDLYVESLGLGHLLIRTEEAEKN